MGTDVATRPASAYDAMGVIAFIEAHRGLAPPAEALAAEYKAMADAAETQPVPTRTKENLRVLAVMQARVAATAATLYAPARQANQQDYDKAQNPRGGSRTIEQKGDVTRTSADGY